MASLAARSAVLPLILLALTLALSVIANGQERSIRLAVSEGRTIPLVDRAASVFIADPEIANVQTPSPETVFVFGKAPGRTTLTAIDQAGRTLFDAEIVVVRAVDDIEAELRANVGDYDFRVSAIPTGLLLTGTVPSPQIAEELVGLAEEFAGVGGAVENRLEVAGQLQVRLKVRVAEVSRDLSKELGFNWDAIGTTGNFAFGLATGRPAITAAGNLLRAPSGAGSLFGNFNDGSTDISGVIDALARDNLISLLAEPSLTAATGRKASFLAGGEFPIPVSGEDGEVTIEFRSFGVSLEFVPLVVTGDQISLEVNPEVSELSPVGAVTTNDFEIPSLNIRRASTTVEVASGQSFAIAGLLQKSFSTTIDAFPGLADVPVIGSLFRSTRFQRDETELLIIVTPYIVRPVSEPQKVVLPTDLVAPPSDLERILFGALTGPERPRWHGAAGFMIE